MLNLKPSWKSVDGRYFVLYHFLCLWFLYSESLEPSFIFSGSKAGCYIIYSCLATTSATLSSFSPKECNHKVDDALEIAWPQGKKKSRKENICKYTWLVFLPNYLFKIHFISKMTWWPSMAKPWLLVMGIFGYRIMS